MPAYYEIKISEAPFEPLLDRGKAVDDVRRAFSQQLSLMRQVVNYGTNLIPRAFGSSDKKLKDIVVIGTLLRQVVAMLDGVEILASSGAVYGAGLQARAVFEASVYIDWVLASESDRKATYYYVHNLRRRRMWAERLQPNSPQAAEFSALMPDLQSLRDPKAIEAAKSTLVQIDENLSLPRFAPINADFDAFAKKKKLISDPAWHAPLGPRTFRAVAKAVNRDASYVVFYATWSEAMHSSNYGHHISIGDGTVTFEPLRILSAFDQLFRVSVATAFHTYMAILNYYRHGELVNFSRKYVDAWQKAFMEVPKIKYTVNKTGPAGQQ